MSLQGSGKKLASRLVFCLATMLLWGSPTIADPPEVHRAVRSLRLRPDNAVQRAQPGLVPGSHIKVFIPSLPYLYTSHAINGALIKPSDNERGWEYDMATSHKKIDDTTYEFKLREGVRFQDGTEFNADAVVLNMEYFKKAPVRYSKIDTVFDRAEKIDDSTVRFYLTEKYGSFMNDVIWMQFYTKTYLETNEDPITHEKVGWNGKASCPNLSMPGPYGLGPYILEEGYIEGDRQSAKAVLRANPQYWDKEHYPKVETVTVFTQLDTEEAASMVLYREGDLDITVIPPEEKMETILGPFSKLVISPSTDNIAIHMNLINGNSRLLDRDVRRALNAALHRNNLLHFVFEDEGEFSPISPYYPGVSQVSKYLLPVPVDSDPYTPEVHDRLKAVLQSLELTVLTQDRYRSLWRGIETQLNKVGVTLDIKFTNSEKDIFGPLLQTNAGNNKEKWDLLVWGNDDWYFNHPFTAFFVFRTDNVWSTVYPDSTMNGYIEDMFRTSADDPEFVGVCEKIMRRAYEESWMLFVPTPNKVFAVNKEVVFRPYRMACIPLWKIQVTDQHWSVRRGAYPETLKRPVEIVRTNEN
ncbi:MAG TPA: ABC transporter substrate-binding protein [Planctomycetaceae bacterium]|nr:ABC transporter substrate-binding protein [Planctomycetaceae bacterium]